MVEMDKAEFKSRLKEIGYSYGKFCAEHGIERRTVYDWKVVPKWAEYWIRWREAECTVRMKDMYYREFVNILKRGLGSIEDS